MDIKKFPIIYQREWVLDILEHNGVEYDQVLIPDADTIIHPNCPNFFELTDHKYTAVVNNGCFEWVMRSIDGWGEHLFPGEEKPKVWTPPSSLDAPPAPDGYRHRWIRAESMGQDDSKNMSGKMRSGWELVRADEYPDHDYPSLNEGRYAGVIGVGGLLLARIPEEVAKSREEYFSQKTADGNEAISSDLLKEQHPSMPINEDRQTRVTFGGSKN